MPVMNKGPENRPEPWEAAAMAPGLTRGLGCRGGDRAKRRLLDARSGGIGFFRLDPPGSLDLFYDVNGARFWAALHGDRILVAAKNNGWRGEEISHVGNGGDVVGRLIGEVHEGAQPARITRIELVPRLPAGRDGVRLPPQDVKKRKQFDEELPPEDPNVPGAELRGLENGRPHAAADDFGSLSRAEQIGRVDG